MIERKTDVTRHYVTNEDLIPHIHVYRQTGRVSEEFGRLLLLIADNYANKGSFHGYTWKQDMVSEAVLTCIKYMHNFDPIRFKEPNPFSYLSSIIRNSFLSYIKKQKVHSFIKDECYQNCDRIDEQEYADKAIDYTTLKDTKNGSKK